MASPCVSESDRTLNIFRIPVCYTESWLYRRLCQVGTIQSYRTHPEPNNKYTAVIVFQEKESIQKTPDYIDSIQLYEDNLSEFFGVKARGTFATWDKRPEPHPLSQIDKTVYVANVDWRVSEKQLFDLFLEAGPVVSVTIPRDPHTLQQRPYGFVVFRHSFIVPHALRCLEGTKLYGKKLYLRPKRGSGKSLNDWSVHERMEDFPFTPAL